MGSLLGMMGRLDHKSICVFAESELRVQSVASLVFEEHLADSGSIRVCHPFSETDLLFSYQSARQLFQVLHSEAVAN